MKKYINYAKKLGNMQPNKCTPNYLYEEACKLRKLGCEVIDEMDMSEDSDKNKSVGQELGAFKTVARAAYSRERFIVISYKPKKSDKYDTALVGKGITFDSGGLNIKPGTSMNEMKFDMLGAAYCLSAVKYAAESKLRKNVLCILPCCENAVGGDAMRPSDVITTFSGKTVEIGHTDAEGRLVLCDGLEYARRAKPKRIVDVATLTGCAMAAVGDDIVPFLTNNNKLSESVLKSAKKSTETFHRLPLHKEYLPHLKSYVADTLSCSIAKLPDTIMAGLFLEMFVGKVPWTHLDIASVDIENGKATGKGLTTLINLVKGA